MGQLSNEGTLLTFRKVPSLLSMYIIRKVVAYCFYYSHFSAERINCGLAKGINVPTSRILERIHDKRRIAVQTGLKLARYFGTSD